MTTQDLLSMSTEDFIANIGAIARSRFDCKTYAQQNLPADDWAVLVGAGVLLPALPREFGGRDSHVEMCRVVETLAEWNLPLGIYTKIKIVVDAATDKLLGVHMLADDAGDVIQAAVYALRFGLTTSDLADSWAPYLTMAESLKLAAQTFTRDVTKLSCCAA